MLRKTIRFILLLAGIIVSFYGAMDDNEPVTVIGALLLVLSLIFNVLFPIKKQRREVNKRRKTQN